MIAARSVSDPVISSICGMNSAPFSCTSTSPALVSSAMAVSAAGSGVPVFTNVLARPQFIAYGPGKKPWTARLAEAMGAIRVCWTVRPEDDINAKEAENVFIFHTIQSTNARRKLQRK